MGGKIIARFKVIPALNIPTLYILLNSKGEILYETAIESIIRNILQSSESDLKFETIVTEREYDLINEIKNFFQIVRESLFCLIIKSYFKEFMGL